MSGALAITPTITVRKDDPACGTVTTADIPDIAKQPLGYFFHAPVPPLSDDTDTADFGASAGKDGA